MWKSTLLRILKDLQLRRLSKYDYRTAVSRVFSAFENDTVNLHANVVEELATYKELGGTLSFWKRVYNARSR